nr:MSMEG_1061 family FMN-dependent PPOX-type flavoprotein [Sphingomonas sp. Y57]
MSDTDPYQISTIEELRAHYDAPSPMILRSKLDFLHDHMLRYMRLAPIVCIASETEAGLDASPRGGEPGFVKPLDRKTLAFADWPGNNKMETFSNVIENGRIGMLFMAPRLDVFLRINGPAIVTRDPAILDRLVEQDKTPKAAVKVSVREAYFHCGKAFRRSALWKPEAWPDTSDFPSVGKVLSDMAKITELSVEQLDAFYNHALEHELY